MPAHAEVCRVRQDTLQREESRAHDEVCVMPAHAEVFATVRRAQFAQ